MKVYNITTKKVYSKNGEEKTAWNTVGRLVKFDATEEKPEGYKIELSMYPTTDFIVFEQKKREVTPQQATSSEEDMSTEPF